MHHFALLTLELAHKHLAHLVLVLERGGHSGLVVDLLERKTIVCHLIHILATQAHLL